MKDSSKTKQKLIEENSLLKQKTTELEKSESERQLAEQRLQESESKLNAMLQSMPDHMSMMDKELNLVWANEAAKRMFGNDIIGRKCYEAYHRRREPCEPYPCLTLKAFNDGGIHEHEIDVVDAAGKAIYFHCTATVALRDKDEKTITVIEISRDITEQKRAEQALRESENLYRTFINATSDMVFLKDELFRNVVVNKSMASFFGKPEKEILGKSDFDLMPQFAAEKCKQTDMESMSKNSIFTSEEIIGEHVYETLKFPVELGHNKIGVGGFIRDITERKQAEEKLRESELKYRSLIESSSDAIFCVDEKGQYKFTNHLFASTFGKTPDYFIGKTFWDVYPKEHADYRYEATRRLFHTGESESLEVEVPLPNETLYFYATTNPIKDETGKVVLNLTNATNITKLKQAEIEKRSLVERLQRAEKMESLGLLAGGVAHDLNNVLGIVVGYAELILESVDAASSIKPHLVNIMNGGQRAAAIVDDLLTLARRGVSGKEVLNLNEIIADCQQSPEFEKLSSYHPAVKIDSDLEPDLPNITCSSVHLGKSLYNLVSNACEAMPKGGMVTIKTTSQYLEQPIQGYDEIRSGDYVVLSVSDTGQGISANDLKRIFEPFYTKKVMGRSGTGLGLAVVWGTAKDHHGYINVESEKGKGSTFTLYFPVTREDITADGVPASISEYMGKSESILVVDDVKEQRDLAASILKALNYNVASVSSGEEAAAYLKENQADLMVLDMIMDPGMDGLDTYQSIIEIRPKQKAIIVSGFSESDRVHEAQGLGAGAYVKKPYIKEKLGLAVRKELDRK